MGHSDMAKKVWAEPKLVVHGDIEHITRQQDKTYGPSDGMLLIPNMPIMNNS
jgi:hypothetical protein